MEIKRTVVEKIRIEDINASHRLDPVEVIIENYGEGAGKILISCWGESWTGYWGSMGGTVEEFFQRVSNDYLINKMSDYQSMVPDIERDGDYLKSLVIKERRAGNITRFEAINAWNHIEIFSPDRHSLCYAQTPEELKFIGELCEPWELNWPKTESPKYAYLERILDLVREVIKPENN